jgi:hypothetical protein
MYALVSTGGLRGWIPVSDFYSFTLALIATKRIIPVPDAMEDVGMRNLLCFDLS